MKFEISFDFSDDNHYIKNNMKQLNVKKERHKGDEFSVDIYVIELNTAEDFKMLYEKLDKIVVDNISLIVTFDDPCIFISYD